MDLLGFSPFCIFSGARCAVVDYVVPAYALVLSGALFMTVMAARGLARAKNRLAALERDKAP